MTTNNKEIRAITHDVRMKHDDEGKIVGYAAVFDKLSEDLGGFREKINVGAFANTLTSSDVRALVDHDGSKILGRNKAGTLTMAEDDHGLRVAITPPDTQAGRDIVESLKRGDIDGMSFAFRTITDDWQMIDGEQIRTLIEVDISEVSVVTFPAYPDTTVAMRSLGDATDATDATETAEETTTEDSTAEREAQNNLENMKMRCIIADAEA